MTFKIGLNSKDHNWRDDARCGDFGPAFLDWSTETQRLVCKGDPERKIPPCPVMGACLEFAMRTELILSSPPSGWPVYGGLDGYERQTLMRLAKKTAATKAKAALEAA